MTAEGISVNLCIEITPEQWCAISASRRGEFYGYWTKAETSFECLTENWLGHGSEVIKAS